MNAQDNKANRENNNKQDFAHQFRKKVIRKLHAQDNKSTNVWFGLGMMGLIGWSVTVPTLLGAALGVWIDNQQIGQHSWTLALLAAGLTIGCFNAWHWVAKEDKAMHEQQEDSNDNNPQN